MPNIHLEEDFDIAVTLVHPEQQSTAEIRLLRVRHEYREYADSALLRSIECPDGEMALILLETRVAELEAQGFSVGPAPFSPQLEQHCTPLDAGWALAANLQEEHHPLAHVAQTQLQNIAAQGSGRSEAEKAALAALGEDFSMTDSRYVYDLDQAFAIEHGGKLFVWLRDLDLVTLHDSLHYHCQRTEIPELDLAYKKLNCIHTGHLRKLFYRPEARHLAYLNLSCGFDSLPRIIATLGNARALGVPMTLKLTGEIEAPAPQPIDGSVVANANVQALSCAPKWLALFGPELNRLRHLSTGCTAASLTALVPPARSSPRVCHSWIHA